MLTEPAWFALLARARENGLLTRLENLVVEQGALNLIPEKARLQLADARFSIALNQNEIRFEVDRVARSLAELDIPIILLKGAAYLLAQLPPARARYAADVDIMVEKQHIDSVEQTLLAAGWRTAGLNDYDEAYFRNWMHEIPPLMHPDRLVAVDVHHTIIPTTSRYKPDTNALFDSAVPLDNRGLKMLCPADMVLHGASHLFNEEFLSGLRDLADLRDLLEHFSDTKNFWEDLLERSSVHGLQRVLYYLLRFARRVFCIDVPPHMDETLQAHAPNIITRKIMDTLVPLALQPAVPGKSLPLRAFALLLLRMRSHWLKMPAILLARHLTTKAIYRWRKRAKPSSRSAQAGPNQPDVRNHGGADIA